MQISESAENRMELYAVQHMGGYFQDTAKLRSTGLNENKSQFVQYQCQQKKTLGAYGLKE